MVITTSPPTPTTRLPRPPLTLFRWIRNTRDGGQLEHMARRAFALLYAAYASPDPSTVTSLMALAGAPVDSPLPATPQRQTCMLLARALEERGYPLTDTGISEFRALRGLGPEPRIDSATAMAYARLAHGHDVVLNITNDEWLQFDLPTRRILQLLMLLGQQAPELLMAIRDHLGIHDSTHAPVGCVLVGKASVMRFQRWLNETHIRLDDAGLEQIGRAMALPGSARIDLTLAQSLAHMIADHDDPPANYEQTLSSGHVINRRTATLLRRAEMLLKASFPLVVIKGSYLSNTALGAHPHNGGGAIDLAIMNDDPQQIERAVQALRQVGFAAWYRDRQRGRHIHAIAIGDRDMSAAARWQIKAYFEGKNGRSTSQPDPHGGLPSTIPPWVLKHRIPFA